ncbi:DUF3899 domain-containing protein [Pisciglobus halotolerans]|uniref:DUF3899 domain-containing protein n=1 Tax=Pisciglobus halotolerans TaxID=745365 RepID=A0A1I3AN70_9LACT|nr:DUF3899 domain-containing protein [Pisciglobus halotolerans]SFH51256.1 protein of unknown function [Pisciglobus halotolerans]
MKKKFTPLNTWIVLTILLFILEWIMERDITFLNTTNLFFFPAGFFLIIGLFSLAIYSGSFDFFHYSMRKAGQRMKKQNEEDYPIRPLSQSVGTVHRFFITVGTGLMVICLLALMGFYLFEH